MQSQIVCVLIGIALGQKLRVEPSPELIQWLARSWRWFTTSTPAAVEQLSAWIALQLADSESAESVPPALPPAEVAPILEIVEPVEGFELPPAKTAAKAIARGAKSRVKAED